MGEARNPGRCALWAPSVCARLESLRTTAPFLFSSRRYSCTARSNRCSRSSLTARAAWRSPLLTRGMAQRWVPPMRPAHSPSMATYRFAAAPFVRGVAIRTSAASARTHSARAASRASWPTGHPGTGSAKDCTRPENKGQHQGRKHRQQAHATHRWNTDAKAATHRGRERVALRQRPPRNRLRCIGTKLLPEPIDRFHKGLVGRDKVRRGGGKPRARHPDGLRKHRQRGGGGVGGDVLHPILHVPPVDRNMVPERGKHRRHRLPHQPAPILERRIQHGHGRISGAAGGFCSRKGALHSGAAVRPWLEGGLGSGALRSCPEAVSSGSCPAARVQRRGCVQKKVNVTREVCVGGGVAALLFTYSASHYLWLRPLDQVLTNRSGPRGAAPAGLS